MSCGRMLKVLGHNTFFKEPPFLKKYIWGLPEVDLFVLGSLSLPAQKSDLSERSTEGNPKYKNKESAFPITLISKLKTFNSQLLKGNPKYKNISHCFRS